ncbi:hypothetical protein C0J52_19074 [Blattella germanica]|nr:hypothetical protein C0J52_19074 [Blattella germanica]
MKGNMLFLSPTWIDDNFLKKALAIDSNTEIVSRTVERVTEPAENFSSVVYRVTLDVVRLGQKEVKSVIVKASNEEISKSRSTRKSFAREMEAYSAILPELTKILESARQPFSPTCYSTSKDPPMSSIVLEDLSSRGFRHNFPSSGLDMQHCIVFVRKLAQYHASSAVLCAKNPNIIDSFKNSGYSGDSENSMGKILPPLLRRIAEEVSNWPDYNERFAGKLSKLADVAEDRLNESLKTNENDFKVLNHEDLRLKNIVFQYSKDSGEVTDARKKPSARKIQNNPAHKCLKLTTKKEKKLPLKHGKWRNKKKEKSKKKKKRETKTIYKKKINYRLDLTICQAQKTTNPDVLEWSQILIEEYYFILEETLTNLGYRHLCPTIAYIYKNFQKSVLFGLILGLADRVLLLADPTDNPDQISVEDLYRRTQLSEQYKSVQNTIEFQFFCLLHMDCNEKYNILGLIYVLSSNEKISWFIIPKL